MTLPLRLRQHAASAAAIAALLDDDPRIAFIRYPGLASHPEHVLAARQFAGGFGGMMAFAVDGDPDTQNRFVSRVAAYPEEFRRWGHLRLSVGLEDTADLLADISASLDGTFGRR